MQTWPSIIAYDCEWVYEKGSDYCSGLQEPELLIGGECKACEVFQYVQNRLRQFRLGGTFPETGQVENLEEQHWRFSKKIQSRWSKGFDWGQGAFTTVWTQSTSNSIQFAAPTGDFDNGMFTEVLKVLKSASITRRPAWDVEVKQTKICMSAAFSLPTCPSRGKHKQCDPCHHWDNLSLLKRRSSHLFSAQHPAHRQNHTPIST